MGQNVFYVKSRFLRICNFYAKKIRQMATCHFPTMTAKKTRDSIAIFHKLNHNKGKKYTYDHFKKCGLSKAGIYYILARFDECGTVDQKSGARRPKSRWLTSMD